MPDAVDADQYLEEIDLRQIARPIRQGMNTSRCRRLHSATAVLTSVTPTQWPSFTSNSCNRVGPSCCFPPVHWLDSQKLKRAWTCTTRAAPNPMTCPKLLALMFVWIPV